MLSKKNILIKKLGLKFLVFWGGKNCPKIITIACNMKDAQECFFNMHPFNFV
jgi:hypothetical protein